VAFFEAVRRVFSQYAVFRGRARRSEFWWFCLFEAVSAVLTHAFDQIVFPGQVPGRFGGPSSAVLQLAILIPSLAVGARRLHDTGRSGWWQVLMLVPVVGIIVLIVWWAEDSHPGSNWFGPSPKAGVPVPTHTPAA
jgi:uncharacterized membrane protein YhaH (DUF805 family)